MALACSPPISLHLTGQIGPSSLIHGFNHFSRFSEVVLPLSHIKGSGQNGLIVSLPTKSLYQTVTLLSVAPSVDSKEEKNYPIGSGLLIPIESGSTQTKSVECNPSEVVSSGIKLTGLSFSPEPNKRTYSHLSIPMTSVSPIEDDYPNKLVKSSRKASDKTKAKSIFKMPSPEAFSASGRLRDDEENYNLSIARSGTTSQLTEFINRINLLNLPDNIKRKAVEIYKLAAQHQKRVRKMEFHLFASIYLAHIELGIVIFPRDLGKMVGVVPNHFMPACLHYPVSISQTSTIPQFVELALKKIEEHFGIILTTEIRKELDKMVEDVIKVPEMARTAADSTAIALVYYFMRSYGISIDQNRYVEYFHFSGMTIETAINRVAAAYNR